MILHADYTEEIGFDLKRRIAKEVGIPICVGAAPTKTLAKLYSKKAKEHGGVFVYNPCEVDALLESVDCGTILGIEPARAKKLLTIQGFTTVQEPNGIRSLEKVARQKKDIITSSRQFSIKVYDMATIECAMVEYTEIAVERLRQQACECQAVQVTISTCNYYRDDTDSQYPNAAIVQLPRLTSYTPDIVNAARLAHPHIFRPGFGYKVVMITLLEIMPAQHQDWLWTVDGWQMKREFLSPCVTTDILVVPGGKMNNSVVAYC